MRDARRKDIVAAMSDTSCIQNSSSRPLTVLITMDVEEEGLFSGVYRRRNPGVSNVAHLRRLVPLSDELGFPLTLLCSWTVFKDAGACRVLEEMRDRHGAEIGAHLHHWSTPPFESDEAFCQGQPQRTHTMDRELLSRRLETLLKAGADFQGAPLTSFRMGRWDLKNVLFPLLAGHGILVDSSICPLRVHKNGADHFRAPAQPYWPLGRDTPFLEVPLTQIPLLTCLPGLWDKVFASSARRDDFHFLAALSGSPFWHNDFVMRLCTRLLRLRHQDVLCVFWHSTEIVPGQSPHVPDEKAADKVVDRILRFFAWLGESIPVRGMTMTQLFRSSWPASSTRWPDRAGLNPAAGDW